MAITQKQIAERLGVSPQTVGFALRGDGTLSQAMRERVLQLASEMGYNRFSNHEARVLSSHRHGKRTPTGMIAVLRDRDFNGVPLREVPYFTPLLDGIEIEAMERDLEVVICSLHKNEMPRIIREEQVDGIVIINWQEKIWEECSRLTIPKVGLAVPGSGDHSIEVADEEGAYLVTRHLLELGHRRIALLTVPFTTFLSRTRGAGYRRAMCEAGIAPADHIVEDTLPCITLGHAAAGAKRLLERRPDVTAIFGLGDLVAIGALQHVQRAGIRVPEELSIVGLDDFSAPYNVYPALTSVSFDYLAMGHRAVQWLHQKSAEAPTRQLETTTEIFPPTLRVRDSSAPPRQ